MTINEYISGKFQTFGIKLSEADLADICMSVKLDGSNEATADNYAAVSKGMIRFIPSLLLRATSISESGFSKSWDIEGIKAYYSFLCKEYGLEDKLNSKPKVTFL